MSVSQPIPLTPGSINISAPPLTYLALLLLYSLGKDLIAYLFPNSQIWLLVYCSTAVKPWHFDARAAEKAHHETSECWGHPQISGDVIHLKVRDAPLCCQVRVSLIGWCRRMWGFKGGDVVCPLSCQQASQSSWTVRSCLLVSVCSNQLHWEFKVLSLLGTWLMHDDVGDWCKYSPSESIQCITVITAAVWNCIWDHFDFKTLTF